MSYRNAFALLSVEDDDVCPVPAPAPAPSQVSKPVFQHGWRPPVKTEAQASLSSANFPSMGASAAPKISGAWGAGTSALRQRLAAAPQQPVAKSPVPIRRNPKHVDQRKISQVRLVGVFTQDTYFEDEEQVMADDEDEEEDEWEDEWDVNTW